MEDSVSWLTDPPRRPPRSSIPPSLPVVPCHGLRQVGGSLLHRLSLAAAVLGWIAIEGFSRSVPPALAKA